MGIIYTKEKLEEAVKQSRCFSDTFRVLGVNCGGNSYQRIRSLIKEYGIDTSHFWKASQAGICKAGICKKKHYSDILTEGQKRRIESRRIRRALQEAGEPYVCKLCGLPPEWQGKKLTLQVDHINGDWSDCRRENLRFVCPNCHTQWPSLEVLLADIKGLGYVGAGKKYGVSDNAIRKWIKPT
jgi:predicted RNA-binding Zn-ribbon protein involved in translation (DUF1610 family)